MKSLMIANLDGLKLLNETAPSSGPCTEKSDRRDQFKDWFLRVAGVFCRTGHAFPARQWTSLRIFGAFCS